MLNKTAALGRPPSPAICSQLLRLCGAPHNRRNWLFFGRDRGGQTLATMTSLTATCEQLHLNPWTYLKDTLTRLPSTPTDQLDSLLPTATN